MDNKISLISKAIQKKFSLFGINKSREITRLVFEISKRDSIDFISVINSIQETKYEKVKKLSNPLEAQGLFQTIVIDPPWDHGDEGDINQFGRTKPEYATMPID